MEQIIEITNKCNLKCRMCDIWKDNTPIEMQQNVFLKVLSDRAKHVALTGGEPFLADIDWYYSATRKILPRAHICIGTNGTLTAEIVRFLCSHKPHNFTLSVSYDGLNTNSKIRGFGSEMTLETIKAIKNYPVRLNVKFTITPENIDDIVPTAQYFRDFGVTVYFKLLESLKCHQTRSPRKFTYTIKEESRIKLALSEVLKSKTKTNKRHIKDIIVGRKRCNWPRDRQFIGINNQVFLCRRMEPIGTIDDGVPKMSIRASEMKSCSECLCFSIK